MLLCVLHFAKHNVADLNSLVGMAGAHGVPMRCPCASLRVTCASKLSAS